MKTLKQLKVIQSVRENEIQKLSNEELLSYIGGTGCCWEAMAYMYNNLYRPQENVSASFFKEQWEEWLQLARDQNCNGAELDESGDPTFEQNGYLLGFLRQYFTTSKSWVRNRVPTTNQGFGFAVIKTNNEDEDHAVIVLREEYGSGISSHYYWVEDPSTGLSYSISANDIKLGTSITEKLY